MNAVEAARAYVKTYFDNSDLAKGVRGAQKQLDSLGSGMTSVGGKAIAAATPILGLGVAAAVSFADAAGAITDLSQVTGIGVESLSELTYASTRLGSDMGSLTGALGKQTKFMGGLAAGSKTALATLDALGISAEDLAGKTGDEQFAMFADAIAGVEDQTEKTNLAMAVFGESGASLLPMLNQGSAGLAEMRQEARDLGLVLSAESVAGGDAFSDSLDILYAQLGAMTSGVGAALAPALTQLLSVVTPMITMCVAWISQNSELIVQVFAIASGVAAAGAGIATLGGVAMGLSMILGGVLAAGSAVAGVLSFLISPIGLVVAGIVGLIAYSTDLAGAWEWLSTSLGESLGLASDLVMNGELSLAMELLWAQIQLTWAQGVQWVVTKVGDMGRSVLSVLAQAVDWIAGMVDKLRNMIARSIAGIGEFLGILPEGTLDELNEMQAAGQVGESALHGLADSLQASADNFENLGGNVDELKAKLAGIQGEAVEANVAAELARAEKATEPVKKPGSGGEKKEPVLNNTGSALAGTFSSNASRQLFSMGGGSVVETELKTISRNTADTASAAKAKNRVGA